MYPSHPFEQTREGNRPLIVSAASHQRQHPVVSSSLDTLTGWSRKQLYTPMTRDSDMQRHLQPARRPKSSGSMVRHQEHFSSNNPLIRPHMMLAERRFFDH